MVNEIEHIILDAIEYDEHEVESLKDKIVFALRYSIKSLAVYFSKNIRIINKLYKTNLDILKI